MMLWAWNPHVLLGSVFNGYSNSLLIALLLFLSNQLSHFGCSCTVLLLSLFWASYGPSIWYAFTDYRFRVMCLLWRHTINLV